MIQGWLHSLYFENKFQLWMLGCLTKEAFIDALLTDQDPEMQKVLIDNIILSDSGLAVRYARYIVEKPWPPGEKVIATNAGHSYIYAKYVLNDRFPLGEKTIKTDKSWKNMYELEFDMAL